METFATGSDRQFSKNEKMSFDLCAVCKRIKFCLALLLFASSEEWAKVGDTERHNLGITVEDDGEFW